MSAAHSVRGHTKTCPNITCFPVAQVRLPSKSATQNDFNTLPCFQAPLSRLQAGLGVTALASLTPSRSISNQPKPRLHTWAGGTVSLRTVRDQSRVQKLRASAAHNVSGLRRGTFGWLESQNLLPHGMSERCAQRERTQRTALTLNATL